MFDLIKPQDEEKTDLRQLSVCHNWSKTLRIYTNIELLFAIVKSFKHC